MFISWTGKGVVTFFILLAAIFVAVPAYVIGGGMMSADGIAPDIDGNMQYLFAFYLLLVALATFPLGRLFLKEPQRKTLVDPKTGEEHVMITPHTVYGVNVRYHAYVFFAGSVLFFLAGLMVTYGLI